MDRVHDENVQLFAPNITRAEDFSCSSSHTEHISRRVTSYQFTTARVCVIMRVCVCVWGDRERASRHAMVITIRGQ